MAGRAGRDVNSQLLLDRLYSLRSRSQASSSSASCFAKQKRSRFSPRPLRKNAEPATAATPVARNKCRAFSAAVLPGRRSTFAMTFLLPLELADPEIRPWLELAEKGARASGTPFISFFTPAEMLSLGREAGFKEIRHVSAETLAQRYFAGRSDGLRPPRNTEELLVASA